MGMTVATPLPMSPVWAETHKHSIANLWDVEQAMESEWKREKSGRAMP